MAFNILDIMNAATKAEAGQNRDYQDIVVNYRDIVVTKHNKYSMDELQEIATGIEMDGLQQPLVLGRVNGEYWLVSGHRRVERGIDPGKERGAFNPGSRGASPGLCGRSHGGKGAEDTDP